MNLLNNNIVGINQILPHKNKWAWDLFLKGCANNWMPTEIPMKDDIIQWNSKDFFTEDERLIIKRCLGFFAGAESLVSNNLLLNIFRYVNDGECRQYLFRQMMEESLHNLTVVYCCDSLRLDIKEVYEAYENIPSIKKKDDFLTELTKDSNRNDIDVNTINGKKQILKNIITYYILCEGLLFYSGFALLLNFKRYDKIPGLAQQIAYTMRDEAIHVEFGTNLINIIVKEDEELWNKEFKQEVRGWVENVVNIEKEFIDNILLNGILGLNKDLMYRYIEFLANLRLDSIGLKKLFKISNHPLPWISEIVELPKNTNFFERKVLEYKGAGSYKDDL